jgi:hypothetical protein
VLGEKHPGTAASRRALANTLRFQAKHSEAESLDPIQAEDWSLARFIPMDHWMIRWLFVPLVVIGGPACIWSRWRRRQLRHLYT